MKTLVIIAAHMRSFARCLPTQHWHVLRKFAPSVPPAQSAAKAAGAELTTDAEPGAPGNGTAADNQLDFAVYTVADRDADSVHALRTLYPHAKIAAGAVSAQPELPIPVKPVTEDWTVGRMYGHEPYGISVHPQAILRQLWQLNEGWKYAKAEGIDPASYDVIIRLRPDSWFRSFVMPADYEMKASLRADLTRFEWSRVPVLEKKLVFPKSARTPWWGRFGGVNDRFAIMGPEAAEAYFTTYERIPQLLAAGCPFHPESLVKASLEAAGCHVDDTLRAEFAKLYPLTEANPQLRGTFRNPEIIEIDMAHLGASR